MCGNSFFDFTTTSLEDLNIFLFLSSKKENQLVLMKHWYELLEEYPCLVNFFSDYLEPHDQLLDLLDRMERTNQPAWSQIAYTSNVKRWIFLFSKRFFKMNVDTQKGILLHELGHTIVYEYKIIEGLRLKWPDGEKLFSNFCAIVMQDTEWFGNNVTFLKDIYDKTVFDLLKIPGEIYANLWVRMNGHDYFLLVLENQFENYKQFYENTKSKIKTRILKFPLFCTILRLQNLLFLLNDENELYDEIQASLHSFEDELGKIVNKNQFQQFQDIKQEIFQICIDPIEINKKYYQLFSKFIEEVQVLPSDFI